MRSSSIRTHLILLVLAMAIPLCTLVGIGIYLDMQQTIATTKASLRILANTMARNTGNRIEAAHHALNILASRPLVKNMDPNQCDPGLNDFLAMNPAYANVGYTDLEGHFICSVRPIPKGKNINASETPWFKAFIQTKGFVIGLPQKGLITGKLVSVLAAPIRNDSQEVIGAIFLPLDLKTYDPLIPDYGLPPESRYGFFAMEGTLIWRNLDPEAVIGTKPNADAARRIVEVKNGEFESYAVDGVSRYFSVIAMDNVKWIAFVGVPATVVYSEAKKRAVTFFIGTMFVLVLLAVLALSISRRISKPVGELEEVARRLHAGELGARVQVQGPREIEAVATQFNQMIEAQQKNTEELRIAA
ncbi:cache and HAMP domain-containing protein, partial [Undibacterium sp.]|uniref:HAMP domain-containing protein n=1 Tax=Undibacterium sp. TaxID=1914977 RepID=UPI00374FDE8A